MDAGLTDHIWKLFLEAGRTGGVVPSSGYAKRKIMDEHLGNMLAAGIFVICLIAFGPAGFFLALAVLVLLIVIQNENRKKK